ncbi:hypothetical protein AAJ76_145000910 [Vairimorpha ceranae]|uniref:Uncharacterized protein n=1 Tax=Vairimorpha ceranae TaxID=40302 RepID=A0A0F9W8F4_9MICR|nr:hypothetical protein AAJ76_145000910 [Vairimorpha ceranae]KKO74001.1 hypothetical protein AAJ76_145000910 [Vairimorpha ceranae]
MSLLIKIFFYNKNFCFFLFLLLFSWNFLYYPGFFRLFLNPLKMLDQTSDSKIKTLEVNLKNNLGYKRTISNKLDSFLSDLEDLEKSTIKIPIFLDLSDKQLINRYNAYTNIGLLITFQNSLTSLITCLLKIASY